MSITDPSIINSLADEINAPAEKEIVTIYKNDSEVLLPGGFISEDGSLIKYAEVRELNGVDEELIYKSGSMGRALATILQRAVVSIGSNPIERDTLDNLLSGDRDALLLGIYRVTFGETVEFKTTCSGCRTELDISVNLSTDVPIKNMEDPIQDRTFSYQSKKHGVIIVGLPTGRAQKKLIENADKTASELNSILLGECLKSINGKSALGITSALNLGMIDRENIINEIVDRNPGPRLGEVKTTCEACGKELSLRLSLAELFRL
jgi:hypothetical protein